MCDKTKENIFYIYEFWFILTIYSQKIPFIISYNILHFIYIVKKKIVCVYDIF